MHPKNELWYDGANYTADALIIDTAAEAILLIQRRDCREWALPGGFIDTNEDALNAAIREASEEAGIGVSDGQLIYQGIVDDPRNTALAWIETSAYVFRASIDTTIRAADDAVDARWFALTDLPLSMYASHKEIIETLLTKMMTDD